MLNNVLLPIFYLPPISWFLIFDDEKNTSFLEQFENFPKQTYRNRANIYGANGKLPLIIPIHHNGKRVMKEIEISYAENWQQLHWKSIKIAYQSSPFFEYYEEKLMLIYEEKPTFLLDFNLKALETIQNIIQIDQPVVLTKEYTKEPHFIDLREKNSAKKESEYPLEEYYQTFSDKTGFLNNLSIVDLLCNIGPETSTYFKRNKITF